MDYVTPQRGKEGNVSQGMRFRDKNEGSWAHGIKKTVLSVMYFMDGS